MMTQNMFEVIRYDLIGEEFDELRVHTCARPRHAMRVALGWIRTEAWNNGKFVRVINQLCIDQTATPTFALTTRLYTHERYNIREIWKIRVKQRIVWYIHNYAEFLYVTKQLPVYTVEHSDVIKILEIESLEIAPEFTVKLGEPSVLRAIYDHDEDYLATTMPLPLGLEHLGVVDKNHLNIQTQIRAKLELNHEPSQNIGCRN